jgi:hypothetical protein
MPRRFAPVGALAPATALALAASGALAAPTGTAAGPLPSLSAKRASTRAGRTSSR